MRRGDKKGKERMIRGWFIDERVEYRPLWLYQFITNQMKEHNTFAEYFHL